MKQIQLSIILKAAEAVDATSEEELDVLVEKYALEQPFLIAHLLQAEEDFDNVDISGLVIYYFAVAMIAAEKSEMTLGKLEPADIDAFHEPFLEELDKFFETEDIADISEFLGQPDMLTYLFGDLKAREDSGEIPEDGELFESSLVVLLALVGLTNCAILKN